MQIVFINISRVTSLSVVRAKGVKTPQNRNLIKN
jgi:hypothetical protein